MSAFWQRIVSFFMTILAFFGIGGKQPDKPVEPPPPQELVWTVESASPYVLSQGACTDGKYIYILMNDSKGKADSVSAIYKIDASTMKTTEVYSNLNFGAGTDMCYNSRTKEILVLFNAPSATDITVLNAADLKVKRKISVDSKIYSIAYDSINDVYYTGNSGGKTITIYNSDFKRTGALITDLMNYGHQSLDYCNGYLCVCTSSANSIFIYDAEGNFYGVYSLPVSENKASGIFNINGKFYMVYSGGNNVCELYRLNEFKAGSISAPVQQVVMNLPVSEKYTNVQGGCASDKYIYELLSNGSESVVYVIDPISWKVKFITEPLCVGHGNDMCYNPVKDEIMIVHNRPNRWEVSVYDAETMQFKRLENVVNEIFCMDYDRENNVYYAGESFTGQCVRFSSDLKAENGFGVSYGDSTTQGMMYHGGKICYILYKPNVIRAYSPSGEYLGEYKLPVSVGEPENAFYHNGSYYITYNKPGNIGGVIYKLSEISFVK